MDADIDLFVHERATGSERPFPVLYENYYHPTQSSDFGGTSARAATTSPPFKELPPIPPDEPSGPANDDMPIDCEWLVR